VAPPGELDVLFRADSGNFRGVLKQGIVFRGPGCKGHFGGFQGVLGVSS